MELKEQKCAHFTSEEKIHKTIWRGEFLGDGSVFKLTLSILLPRKGKHSREWVNLPLQLIKPWSSHEHCCAWNVYNETESLNSLHDPVFKSLSSAMKVAIFGKPLWVHLETLQQGQIQCLNTCTLNPFQNLFPFSYFLSLQLFLCQFFQCTLIKGLFLKHVAFFWCLHGFIGQACRINRSFLMFYFILTHH